MNMNINEASIVGAFLCILFYGGIFIVWAMLMYYGVKFLKKAIETLKNVDEMINRHIWKG